MKLPPFPCKNRFCGVGLFILAEVLLYLLLFGLTAGGYALSAGAILAGVLAFFALHDD
jgi:multisubunit Na+/H+ antiporter MnhB subunit